MQKPLAAVTVTFTASLLQTVHSYCHYS